MKVYEIGRDPKSGWAETAVSQEVRDVIGDDECSADELRAAELYVAEHPELYPAPKPEPTELDALKKALITKGTITALEIESAKTSLTEGK